MKAFIDVDVLEQKLSLKSTHIERILGLEFGSLKDKKFVDLPETQALFKILYSMPWIIEVAENRFDPEISQWIQTREAANVKIKELQAKK